VSFAPLRVPLSGIAGAVARHRAAALPRWLRCYNERRPHSSLGGRPPISRVHDVCGQDTTPASARSAPISSDTSASISSCTTQPSDSRRKSSPSAVVIPEVVAGDRAEIGERVARFLPTGLEAAGA
jgi:hypothetical protein